MAIFRRSNLTSKEIRLGLNAFILVARESKSDFLKIDNFKVNFEDKFEKVYRALRLVGMSISEKILKKWFEHVYFNLDCLKRDRRDFELMKEEFDKISNNQNNRGGSSNYIKAKDDTEKAKRS